MDVANEIDQKRAICRFGRRRVVDVEHHDRVEPVKLDRPVEQIDLSGLVGGYFVSQIDLRT